MVASQINLAEYLEAKNQRVAQPLHLTSVKTGAISTQGVEMVFESQSESYRVLKSIDLEVRSGTVQFLMGPSGSGKTTLLSILAGLLTPTKGHVHLLGQDITRLSRRQLSRFRLENIGFIFQGFNLFPALNTVENVEVSLGLKGIKGAKARRLAMELLEQVGLAHKAQQRPGDLSGGQKQRVAIARALAGNPPLIMADEPTAALDAESGLAVAELLHGLAKEHGRTVLVVTHDPRIAHFADRIVHLENGVLKHQVKLCS